jgi:hypothetical protein
VKKQCAANARAPQSGEEEEPCCTMAHHKAVKKQCAANARAPQSGEEDVRGSVRAHRKAVKKMCRPASSHVLRDGAPQSGEEEVPCYATARALA